MPEILVDGRAHTYDPERDTSLLKFLREEGVEVPYFCYHPAMSVPTNCRMCLVEVGMPMTDRETREPILDEEGKPKIMWGRKPNTACNTRPAPGMVVKTSASSEVIKKAQKGVLEFMLINHPLDCPICDQAGECPLQIQTYKHGPEGSRFELDKGHKPKRVQLGPHVTLDAERCINCTRCTRFTEEISGTSQLSIIARGEKNYPATAPGTVFDDPYSLNVVDLCPVGALTSTDFRFKARAWEMNYTPSICTGCAKGCSIDVWVRDNRVLRLTPRHNPAVNDYWMCDEGRLDYPKYNLARLSGPKVKNDVPVEWPTAWEHAAQLLAEHQGKTLFLGSAYASVESNAALQLLAEHFGGKAEHFVTHIETGWGDDFLRRNDRTPNAKGCELLGLTGLALEDLKLDDYTLVYALEDTPLAEHLAANYAGTTILHATTHFVGFETCTLLLPAATEIEQPGTFLNEDGIAQLTQQARQIRHMTPEDWMAMAKSRLDAGGQLTDRWRKEDHILDVLAGWRIVAGVLAAAGADFTHGTHAGWFGALQERFEVLQGLQPTKKGLQRAEVFKHDQLSFAIDLRAKTF